jgi:hypothetical protein
MLAIVGRPFWSGCLDASQELRTRCPSAGELGHSGAAHQRRRRRMLRLKMPAIRSNLRALMLAPVTHAASMLSILIVDYFQTGGGG